MQKRETLFDDEHQLRRTRACQAFLRQFLLAVADDLPATRALDVACGVGYFSETLLESGFEVSAIDARGENIDEASRRIPDAKFLVHDVESDAWKPLGCFPVVVCFGLLYHLENPLSAVRGLFEVTESILLVEAQIAPGESPAAVLMNEPDGEDKALNGVAFVPTENCLVKMCYQAGFTQVYGLRRAPDNPYFRKTRRRERQRTILVAVKAPFPPERELNLVPVAEPDRTRPDLWVRRRHQVLRGLRRLFQFRTG